MVKYLHNNLQMTVILRILCISFVCICYTIIPSFSAIFNILFYFVTYFVVLVYSNFKYLTCLYMFSVSSMEGAAAACHCAIMCCNDNKAEP